MVELAFNFYLQSNIESLGHDIRLLKVDGIPYVAGNAPPAVWHWYISYVLVSALFGRTRPEE